MEKISHVKNPLTVIALFAALAEVSGTVMLPAMDPEVQKIFVWYVMIFPMVLVISFFGILLTKHQVLYAPSDFREDESFWKLFTPIITSTRSVEVKGEIAVGELEADIETEHAAEQTPSNEAEPVPKPIPEAAPELEPEVETRSVPEVLRSGTVQSSLKERMFLELLVVEQMSHETGLTFRSNVALTGDRRIEFDAVALTQSGFAFLEVKYIDINAKIYNIEQVFRNIQKFANKQNLDPRNIELYYVIITRPEITGSEMADVLEILEKIRGNYFFKTKIKQFTPEELTGS